MQIENAIEVQDITKSFKIFYDKGNQLKERVLFRSRNRYENRTVIDGISFHVKRGEAVGLIGHNGCGKSTILKLLTRIIYPDSGSIRINGRVSSLIELGAGFHPDMSGRENIYINAAIFGLTKHEINKRIKGIVQFAELEEFIDNPVRTYSSGMYMRLAFSVAIHVDADVLLIDEILAVGDVNFQQKCFEKLKEIKNKGTTIVIVSHSLSQIEQICERSIWIENGKIREDGIPKYVHDHYLKVMENNRMDRMEQEQAEQMQMEEEPAADSCPEEAEDSSVPDIPSFCSPQAVRMGNHKVEFVNVEILDAQGNETYGFQTEDAMDIVLSYRLNVQELKGNAGIGIYRDDGVYCFGTNTDIEKGCLIDLKECGKIRVHMESLPLLYGTYYLDVAIHAKDSMEIYDDIRNVKKFQVFRSKKDDGLLRINTEWFSDA